MKYLIGFLTLMILLFSCKEKKEGPSDTSVILNTKKAASLIEADNAFAFDLFKEVMASAEERNFMISPVSVSIALGMAYNAAEGQTKMAFEETMRLSGLSSHEINQIHGSLIRYLQKADPKVKLEIANAIWLHNLYTLNRTFADTSVYYYDAEANTLDFFGGNAKETMNKWVADKTNNKITSIIDRIPPEAVSYIMNAIYFYGSWTTEFDKEKSGEMEFFYEGGGSSQVPSMQMETTLSFLKNDLFTAVDLPYGEGKFSMTVFLPSEGMSVKDLVATFTTEKWSEWLSSFEETEDVFLQMPKFKYEYKKKLNSVLKDMGLGVAFTGNAEFPYLIEEDLDLCISEVIHKTFIDVNEEGTEAAAVTSIGFEVTSVGPEKPRLIINRPFLYVIREKTSNALLFMGKVGAPDYE